MKHSVTTLARNIGLVGALAAGAVGLTAHAASAEEQVITRQVSGWSEETGQTMEEYYALNAKLDCQSALNYYDAKYEVVSVTPRNPGDDGIAYTHQTAVFRCWR